ncbi:MAG: biotin/lipoyl-binding protein [Bacteroidales bacterium]|nr:biotin/lipoyl-binding protein [Bacteroidales bacterium]
MKEFKFLINGHSYEVAVNEIENQLAEVTVNGTTFQVQIEKEQKAAVAPIRRIQSASVTTQTAAATQAKGIQTVKSPLPGSIVKVNVKVGDQVKAGDELLTMESMKMENSIKSEYTGVVKAVLVEAGKNVMQDDKLIEIETVASAPVAQPEAPKAAPVAPQAQPASAPQPSPAAAPAGGLKVVSPLPGSVVKVAVAEGQQVKKGNLLLTLESMKMENNVLAEQDGVIKQIAVSAGQNVMQDDLLVVIG